MLGFFPNEGMKWLGMVTCIVCITDYRPSFFSFLLVKERER